MLQWTPQHQYHIITMDLEHEYLCNCPTSEQSDAVSVTAGTDCQIACLMLL